MIKRSKSDQIADLKTELANERSKTLVAKREAEEAKRTLANKEAKILTLDAVTRERDDLRRQLARIRDAHGPLHTAIYPNLMPPNTIFGGAVLDSGIPGLFG